MKTVDPFKKSKHYIQTFKKHAKTVSKTKSITFLNFHCLIHVFLINRWLIDEQYSSRGTVPMYSYQDQTGWSLLGCCTRLALATGLVAPLTK